MKTLKVTKEQAEALENLKTLAKPMNKKSTGFVVWLATELNRIMNDNSFYHNFSRDQAYKLEII